MTSLITLYIQDTQTLQEGLIVMQATYFLYRQKTPTLGWVNNDLRLFQQSPGDFISAIIDFYGALRICAQDTLEVYHLTSKVSRTLPKKPQIFICPAYPTYICKCCFTVGLRRQSTMGPVGPTIRVISNNRTEILCTYDTFQLNF